MLIYHNILNFILLIYKTLINWDFNLFDYFFNSLLNSYYLFSQYYFILLLNCMDHNLITFIFNYDLILIPMNVVFCFISQVHALEGAVILSASYCHCLTFLLILFIISVIEDGGFIIIVSLINNCLLVAIRNLILYSLNDLQI